MILLQIKNLHASVNGKEIIKGLNLTINEGEVHAIMGPNGAGKSTLSYVLSGREGYEITSGSIIFKGKNLNEMSIEERACEGLFLLMQYPVELPGVPITNFLKHSVNAIRKYKGEQELDTLEFIKEIRSISRSLGFDDEMLKRHVNVGFSGGEKKKLEILQMAMLKPSLAILDEADSGLDIDALKVVADGVNSLRDNKRSMLIITHYQRLLSHIIPDYVHIFSNGKIVKSGGKELALKLEESGYCGLKEE